MNQKQLAYLKTLLTPQQLTTFLEMKKTRPKKEIDVKVVTLKPKCQATKKDKTLCSNNSTLNEKYCGIHMKTLEKVSKKLTDDVILSAVA